MSSYVSILELKEGDKFYYLDGLIYIMIECNLVNPNQIDFVAKKLGTCEYIKLSLHSQNVQESCVFRYTRRDKPSFNNGFKYAIEYCKQFMTAQEQANAYLDDDIKVHIMMNGLYNKWKSINRL